MHTMCQVLTIDDTICTLIVIVQQHFIWPVHNKFTAIGNINTTDAVIDKTDVTTVSFYLYGAGLLDDSDS